MVFTDVVSYFYNSIFDQEVSEWLQHCETCIIFIFIDEQLISINKDYFLRVKSSLPKSIYLSEPLARFFQINFKKQLTQKPKCAAALVTDSIKR